MVHGASRAWVRQLSQTTNLLVSHIVNTTYRDIQEVKAASLTKMLTISTCSVLVVKYVQFPCVIRVEQK